jgi:hypothetical protein
LTVPARDSAISAALIQVQPSGIVKKAMPAVVFINGGHLLSARLAGADPERNIPRRSAAMLTIVAVTSGAHALQRSHRE